MPKSNGSKSPRIIVEIIGAIAIIIAAFIGSPYIHGVISDEICISKEEYDSIKVKISDLENSNEKISEELELNQKAFKEKTALLNGLVSSIGALNKTTLIQWHNTKDSWSGFGDRDKKGEHMMQCAVDRFMKEWRNQLDPMRTAGCTVRDPGDFKVQHGDHCE